MRSLLFIILIFQAEVLFGRSIKNRLKKGMYDKLIMFETTDENFMANQSKFPVNGIMDIKDDKMTYIDKEKNLYMKMKMLFAELIKNKIEELEIQAIRGLVYS
jgi:hypothetical protein